MKATVCGFGLVAVLWGSLASAARADEVVLRNGDRLKGAVTRQGDVYVVEHHALGRVSVAAEEVARVVRDPCAAPAPPAAAEAPGPSAPTCTRCPLPTEEVKARGKRPWDFSIRLALSNDAGNTEKFQFNLDTEGEYRFRRNRLNGRVNWFYEESDHVQTEGKLFANATYEREITARGRLFATWLIDRDDFADILYRTGWFVGYAYDFIKRERTTLTGKVGGGVVVESRKGEDVIRTPALLAALTYKHEFRWGDSFKASGYVVPYLDYAERSPMRLELLYAHPLRRHLDLTAGFLLDYVPDPPGVIESYDTKVTFGIRWKP